MEGRRSLFARTTRDDDDNNDTVNAELQGTPVRRGGLAVAPGATAAVYNMAKLTLPDTKPLDSKDKGQGAGTTKGLRCADILAGDASSKAHPGARAGQGPRNARRGPHQNPTSLHTEHRIRA